MASPYSISQSIISVPTTPLPANPHSIIPPSPSSEGSPDVSQQTYLSPHSIITSSEVGLSSPASSSATATTTRSPQAISTGPDHPDSKKHQQQPVVYNASVAGGTPRLWSQATNLYYPLPLPQYEDQGQQYAKATIEPQQQQPQQHYQQQYQQQQYQQYQQQQQQPSEQSFPMYPVEHPNATISHNTNDPDHHKPPTDTKRKKIIGGKKRDFQGSKKFLCLLILVPIIVGIVVGVVIAAIVKKNNNDSNNSPSPGGVGGSGSSGGSSSTRTTTTTTGSYPAPTGGPDIMNCVLKCQETLTACTEKCGSPSNMECQQGCISSFTNCSLGCASGVWSM